MYVEREKERERERERGEIEPPIRWCPYPTLFVGMGVGVVGLSLLGVCLTRHETWHSACTRSRAKGYRHWCGSSRKATINGRGGGGGIPRSTFQPHELGPA